MAKNEKNLDELLDCSKADDTELFLRRIAVLALENAGIATDKDGVKKFNVPMGDKEEDLAKDWTNKLYNVAKAKSGTETVNDDELTEFQQTMEKWGHDLGATVVKETAKAIKSLKKDEQKDEKKLKECIYDALKPILDSWRTTSIKNRILSVVSKYSQRIQNVSKKLSLLSIVKKADTKK